jgi:hypothetical protein
MDTLVRSTLVDPLLHGRSRLPPPPAMDERARPTCERESLSPSRQA